MAYVCRSCSFFDGECAHASECPECGGAMRFTLLDPRGMAGETSAKTGSATATTTLEAPPKQATEAWQNTYTYGYDEIEAPWAIRYAQIGVGIATYFIFSRFILPIIMLPIYASLDEMSPAAAMVVLALTMLVNYSVSALIGGFMAGAWSRNWVPQGLGVAAGILIIPLVLMLIFAPEHVLLMLVLLVITSGLTVVGAFLGHLVVKPTRIPRS